MDAKVLGPAGWLALCLGFAMFELLGAAPFVAVFFAVGALAAAVGASTGWLSAPWSATAAFIVVSVVPLLLLRSRLVARVERHRNTGPVDALVGAQVTLLQPLAPHGTGAGTLRGARWQVRNVGATTLAAQTRASVVELEGLTLLVAHAAAKENDHV